MQGEPARGREQFVGEPRLREHLLAPYPHLGQGPEGRPVEEPCGREAFAYSVHGNLLGPGGGPLAGSRNGVDAGPVSGGEEPAGVAGPGPAGERVPTGRLDTAVYLHRTAPSVIRPTHGEAELHSPLLRQDERRFERQLLHFLASDLVPGPHRQLDESRAGHHDVVPNHVVGEPGVRTEESRPVNRNPSESGSSTAAPSNGWPADPMPTEATSSNSAKESTQ